MKITLAEIPETSQFQQLQPGDLFYRINSQVKDICIKLHEPSDDINYVNLTCSVVGHLPSSMGIIKLSSKEISMED